IRVPPREASTEIPRQPEDTLSPTDRAAPARALTAATGKAVRRRALRHAEAQAWAVDRMAVAAVLMVAEAGDLTAVAAGITKSSGVLRFWGAGKTCKWREYKCSGEPRILASSPARSSSD